MITPNKPIRMEFSFEDWELIVNALSYYCFNKCSLKEEIVQQTSDLYIKIDRRLDSIKGKVNDNPK